VSGEAVAWVALALALLELVVIVSVVVIVARFWRQVAPTVEPLLAMFAQPTETPTVPVDE
jgi:hypothetical protein